MTSFNLHEINSKLNWQTETLRSHNNHSNDTQMHQPFIDFVNANNLVLCQPITTPTHRKGNVPDLVLPWVTWHNHSYHITIMLRPPLIIEFTINTNLHIDRIALLPWFIQSVISKIKRKLFSFRSILFSVNYTMKYYLRVTWKRMAPFCAPSFQININMSLFSGEFQFCRDKVIDIAITSILSCKQHF